MSDKDWLDEKEEEEEDDSYHHVEITWICACDNLNDDEFEPSELTLCKVSCDCGRSIEFHINKEPKP